MAKPTKKERKEQKKIEYQEVLKKQKMNDMLKKAAIWGGAALILIASVWGLILLSNSTSNSKPDVITAPPISKDDITIGSQSAKVSLVEYSDFQCPACAAYNPLVGQILTEFNGKIIYVYRFFPLSQTHKNALVSAQAAYAAHKQGKFKEMNDMLFNTQNDWAEKDNPQDIFTEYARKIELDIDKFKKDMDSDEAKNKIQKDTNQGTDIGVNSTPTFFLNNNKIENPGTYDNFKKLIENELSKK